MREARHFVVERASAPNKGTSLMRHLKHTRLTNAGGAGGAAAAKKAMTQLHRATGKRVKSAVVTVRETTQGSLKKTFTYRTRVIKARRPKLVKLQGAGRIRFEHETIARAV